MVNERLDHDEDSPWTGEHYFRYDAVLQYIDHNDRVLDIACGEGYGTYKISQTTSNKVFGGDISQEAVNQSATKWIGDNIEFRVMDGTKLDFESEYFDKIVSFETIEHTTKYREMLLELNRVLKSDGVAFISTPNILINSPKGFVENPYHTQEWQFHELEEILNNAFDEVKIFGQKYSRYDDPAIPKVGMALETVLTQRLIRRLPTDLKNRVANLVIGKRFYPQSDDFSLVSDPNEIVKCQTFFCICKKRKA